MNFNINQSAPQDAAPKNQKERKMRTNIANMAIVAAVLGAPAVAMAGDGWTGFYAGAHIAVSDGDLSSGTASVSDHSAAYGLQLGYNHSLANNWVAGGEISYSTAEYSAFGPSKDIDTTRLKLKAGYDFGPAMVYGVLGYANVDPGGKNEDGITYGVGVGHKATDNIILNAEILRDSFDIGSSGADVDVTSLAFGVSYQF